MRPLRGPKLLTILPPGSPTPPPFVLYVPWLFHVRLLSCVSSSAAGKRLPANDAATIVVCYHVVWSGPDGWGLCLPCKPIRLLHSASSPHRHLTSTMIKTLLGCCHFHPGLAYRAPLACCCLLLGSLSLPCLTVLSLVCVYKPDSICLLCRGGVQCGL